MTRLARLFEAVRRGELSRRLGVVRRLHGLAIEAAGPRSHVGELCAIVPPGADALRAATALLHGMGGAQPRAAAAAILAEVVGIQPGHVTLLPYGSAQGLTIGSTVVALGDRSTVAVGDALMGRVVDGFERPLDGRPAPELGERRPLRAAPRNPMQRPRIGRALETGIRSIDALLTLGHGQRVGIFSGSGVGKSTLLGMIARHVKADVNVIALVGERGREVREFIDKQLGADGLRRSVVVVATADQPALSRLRAAHAAVAIAEHFRDAGKHVLLTMDSITRFAMARREVGLSAGEPPTARGYTPSVFAELPELCERCGTSPSGGSISALFTVLVEGDDLNEPVSDALRAILDGHLVLSRQLANQGQYPAIDLLRSASRVLPDVTTPDERELVREAIALVALLERTRQMVELGAYEKGANPELDAALALRPRLQEWLRQAEGGVPRADAVRQLAAALDPPAQPEAGAQGALPPTPARAAAAAPRAVAPAPTPRPAAPIAARGAPAPARPAAARPAAQVAPRKAPPAKGTR